MENEKKAYEEILSLIKKYEGITVFDVRELETQAKNHLFGLSLKEEYGLDLDPRNVRSTDYQRFGEHRAIGIFGEKYRRTVSWEDNEKQPEDEILFCFSFSTGPYVFGDDYPEDLFKEMWAELKSYGPTYIDTANKGMYFSLETAAPLFNSFEDILKKYREKYRAESKERKMKKLEAELQRLKDHQ